MFAAGIYRPPNKPLGDFIQFITGTLEYTNNYRANFTGHSNVDVMNHSNVAGNYNDMFHQYSFSNEINLPTYMSPSSGNTTPSTDHIWHNINSLRGNYVVSPALSDQYAVFVILEVEFIGHLVWVFANLLMSCKVF